MKKLFFAFLLLLLIGGVIGGSVVKASPQIIVDFPNPIPLTLSELPIKITIPHPDSFGYPRVPVSITVSIAGFRNHELVIPLLFGVDLNDPQSVYKFLNSPIEKEVNYPLPKLKKGDYKLLIDVQCLYGPHYSWNFWYSFTYNYPLEVVNEKIHIVSGPEVIEKPTEVVGYFGTNHGTFTTPEGIIDIVDIINEEGIVIDKVSVIRDFSGTNILKVISSRANLWKPEKYSVFGYQFYRLRKYLPFGKFYGYSFSQSILYDWSGKGVSFRFKVQVVKGDKILYEEPYAEVGTVWSYEELTPTWIKKEKETLEEKYKFLLNQFAGDEIKVLFESLGTGNWRWLFSVQPSEWVAEHGTMIEAAIPQLLSGEPFFPGLQGIEWPGLRWNPYGDVDGFQLEIISN